MAFGRKMKVSKIDLDDYSELIQEVIQGSLKYIYTNKGISQVMGITSEKQLNRFAIEYTCATSFFMVDMFSRNFSSVDEDTLIKLLNSVPKDIFAFILDTDTSHENVRNFMAYYFEKNEMYVNMNDGSSNILLKIADHLMTTIGRNDSSSFNLEGRLVVMEMLKENVTSFRDIINRTNITRLKGEYIFEVSE